MSTVPELPVPDLDDLRFQPLVDAAKRALPGRAPGWTDHNVSDPGVTLIEACAERVDLLLYRVARMTPAQRDRLLRLMGIAPVPAMPFRVRVAFTRDGGEGDVTVPAGTELRTDATPPVTVRTVVDVMVPMAGTAMVEAVEQPSMFQEEFAASPDRAPAQRFRPSRRPWSPPAPQAEPAPSPLTSVTVDGDRWDPVWTFARKGADATCYWWDDATGEVVFGPLAPGTSCAGVQRGKVPPAGAAIAVEYAACRGPLAELLPGTPLVPPSGVPSAKVADVVAAGQDAETWRDALDRAALGLAPLRRAVTVQDHERLLTEHAPGIARCRVNATVRPADTSVPPGLLPPKRPVPLLTCAVPVRPEAQPRAVHYFPGGSAGVDHKRVLLNGTDEGKSDDDAPPEFAKYGVDAVLHLAKTIPRLWCVGSECAWGAGERKLIAAQFLGVPAKFTSNLDAVAALPAPGTTDEYEVFLFKGEEFYHRRYQYANSNLTPSSGRGVQSLTAEAFPGLSPDCQHAPDAVVTVGGVFYFLKGARSEPTLWLSEDAALRVLLVPPLPRDPELPLDGDDLKIPTVVLEEARRVLAGARLLGERLHAGPPDYVRFAVGATVRPWIRKPDDVIKAAKKCLYRFFHPTAGGPDGCGWPWGRRVHAGDVLSVLEQMPEIRAVAEVTLRYEGGNAVPAIEVPDSGLVHLLTADLTVDTS
ncbi:hypothetical protein ABZ851_15060 [Streptomyces sp. NPDC047049]|uniref:hypothetical protein n=1 Tax=Streptomyces sp. NPDC047049 TaxID=3156688 RepID=UPI0033D9E346